MQHDRHRRSLLGQLGAGALTFAICVGAYLTGDRAPAAVMPSEDTTAPVTRAPVAEPPPASEAACHAALRKAGVGFRVLPPAQAVGIAWPVGLSGPVDGVRIHGSAPDASTDYLDCKLALALHAWAPRLRARGVVGLTHYSMYRQDAVVADTHKPSAHASGLAIDVGSVELRDGRSLSVLTDWQQRARGADPCARSPRDSEAGRTLRSLVCDAAEHQLFQTVLTPHYDDAHANHVHLELASGAEPYVH